MATQGNDTSAVSQREYWTSIMTKYGTRIGQVMSQYKPTSPPKIISDHCYVYRLKKKTSLKCPEKLQWTIIPNLKL